MQITSQQRLTREIEGRAVAALALGILSLVPCLWVLGPFAYRVGASARARAELTGRRGAGMARVACGLGLAGSTFLLLGFVYAVATVAGVVASPH
jgi:hypothetical protein